MAMTQLQNLNLIPSKQGATLELNTEENFKWFISGNMASSVNRNK